MSGDTGKERLHERLRGARATMLWKLDGVDEYDARRPLTPTGTNLLGLVKHLSVTEALYFGDVFGRPTGDLPDRWWDDEAGLLPGLWVTADESRAEVVDRYRRMGERSDATIAGLGLDAPGHVLWWPQPDVTLFDVLVHVVAETSRHAGHADILREQIDGAVGADEESAAGPGFDEAFWARHRGEVEQAARTRRATSSS